MVPGLCPKGPFLITPIPATWPGIGDFLALVLSVHFHYSPVFVVSFQCPLSKLWSAKGQRPPVLLTAISQHLAWCLHTLDPRGYPRGVSQGEGAEPTAPGWARPPCQRLPDCRNWPLGVGRQARAGRLGCEAGVLDSVLSGGLRRGTREMQYLRWVRPLLGCSWCLPKLGLAQSRTPCRPQAVAAVRAVSSAQPVLHAPREARRSPQGHGPLPSSQGSPASLSHLEAGAVASGRSASGFGCSA